MNTLGTAAPRCCKRNPANVTPFRSKGLIRPGVPETKLNQEIFDLAKEMYGISTYWHKRIVARWTETRARSLRWHPPDLTIGEDDILFLDLGPVFEEWEADFGRTFVDGEFGSQSS